MLKLQYFGHLMRIADSFEKTLMLGKIEVKKRRGREETEATWWRKRRGQRGREQSSEGRRGA